MPKGVTFNRFPELAARLPQVCGQIVRKTALALQAEARESMSGGKSGRVYFRGGKVHQASAPGEPPAIDAGSLANSIQVEMTSQTTAAVYTVQEYAPVLEFGGGRIAARPFFEPAARSVEPEFVAALAALEQALQ